MTKPTQTTCNEDKTKQALKDLIERLAGPYDKTTFLREQEEFISYHLDYMFSTYEGSACSHDKTRTVIEGLKRFFDNGVEIEFNYNEEYTYHMPKVIMKEHDKIMEAYHALENLYYGNPIKYLSFLSGLAKDKEHD